MEEKRDLLLTGDIEIQGLIPESSNGAIKAKIKKNDSEISVIIKPAALIRPLWDFPELDLNNRELATFELSHSLELNLVPLSVSRNIPEIGECLVQEWIEEVSNQLIIVRSESEIPYYYKKVINGYDELNKLVCLAHEDEENLRKIAIFDLIINNADRKGGHILKDGNGKIWMIDHGLTWHQENKLRTILWGWIGEKFQKEDLQLFEKAKKEIANWIENRNDLLSFEEMQAALNRIEVVLQLGKFPEPSKEWPAIPWPIF
ncbi:MAG: hypothetical protein RLZZ37_196 [Actinomycetota bacterium]